MEQVKADHAEMRNVHRHLLKTVEQAVKSLWSVPEITLLIDALYETRDHLEKHFHQEEIGGYLEEALAMAPRLTPQANILRKQHEELYQTIDGLAGDSEGARLNPTAWPDLVARIRELIKQLAAHEAAENQLVQQAFNIDFGA